MSDPRTQLLEDIALCAKEWCDAVDRDTSWDGWDHHFKEMKWKLLPRLATARVEASASPPPSPAGEGWQSFDTAPKNGTKFDVWYPARPGRSDHPAHRLTDVYWSDVQEDFCTDGDYGPEEPSPLAMYPRPTHWRPIPPPPGSEPSSERYKNFRGIGYTESAEEWRKSYFDDDRAEPSSALAEIPRPIQDRDIPASDSTSFERTLISSPFAPALAEAMEVIRELVSRAENFWQFLQGEHGVKLSSEDQDDHNVSEFLNALAEADTFVCKHHSKGE